MIVTAYDPDPTIPGAYVWVLVVLVESLENYDRQTGLNIKSSLLD